MYPRRNVRFGYGGLREKKKKSHRREIKRVAVRERELKREFEREKAMRERERESW
jgi:hypothetical protein